ncbi:glucosaminidase domain-containing protein [Bacteroides sp. 224]|uniref:glucosaminidase domain-containing protein n=1 Tax=Bacteroides sp. 224 TaxID=2302936 RepID=UPI0013D409A5|nr:glucosaminidase domain-containing protein [Bacteroides sp. 224]NDV66608.1 LysM peptidoglycan-binding domain-containing protein [Bacteroides sp. 224]
MYKKPSILLSALLLIFSLHIHAQYKSAVFVAYVEKYGDIAVEQMKLHKIPASITLAQGLLESGAGQSALAKESNNHFGIKCGSSWTGKTVKHHDDARNECFRAYKNVSDSYEDHSIFLTSGARYAFLFNLDVTDYEGWAKGLKKAGYATDPSYANRLITIIEDYELYLYDQKGKNGKKEKEKIVVNPHQVYKANGMAYVVARYGDTFEALEAEFDISKKKLIKYNDLFKEYTLVAGDIVYLCQKKKKADNGYTVYVVKTGDSMHSISQKYGVRLKYLYKMNNKTADYLPAVGDYLRLR